MTQDERRIWLIEALLAERNEPSDPPVPEDPQAQRDLLRALFNVRPPEPASPELLAVQDAYLVERLRERGAVQAASLPSVADSGPDAQLALWRGDITLLAADAIVNAANNQMLGCFVPGHTCIDNAIHTFAGIQLRLECERIMAERGRPEPTGTATLTAGYNLPAKHVIHTVGPIVQAGKPTPRDELLLRRSYRSCMEAADEAGLASLAFCCISTGVFGYPYEQAAWVAVNEVRSYLARTGSRLRVIFNVFLERDEVVYRTLLGQ